MKNPPAVWEIWVQILGWEDPLEKGTATHSSILTGESHELYSPWDHSQTQLKDFRFLSPALQGGSLPSEPPGKTKITKLISEAESE